MSRKRELKQLLAQNEFEELFKKLSELLPSSDTLLLNEARYNKLLEKNDEGILEVSEFDVGMAKVRKALINLINSIPEQDEERAPFHEFHKYTCDRVEQFDAFHIFYDELKARKTQFYYIYGWEPHSPAGLFKRIAYDLEGKFYEASGQPVHCQSYTREIAIEESYNLERYKENILKELFSEFGISPNSEEPLLQKDLSYLWQNSPALKAFGQNDFVCVLLSIYDLDWNPDVTPDAVKWFIEQFCECVLPEEAPQFLFFFGIIYEEEEDPEIEEEVLEAIRSGEHIKILPELNSVPLKYVKKWFTRYKVLAPTSRDRRAIIGEHFEGDSFLMEDIELTLEELIDKYNKGLL